MPFTLPEPEITELDRGLRADYPLGRYPDGTRCVVEVVAVHDASLRCLVARAIQVRVISPRARLVPFSSEGHLILDSQSVPRYSRRALQAFFERTCAQLASCDADPEIAALFQPPAEVTNVDTATVPAERPRAMTTDEMRLAFVTHLYETARYWAGLDGSNVAEGMPVLDRITGFAFSALVAIDGEAVALPPFLLVPHPHATDAEHSRANGEHWWAPANLAGGLHELLAAFERQRSASAGTHRPIASASKRPDDEAGTLVEHQQPTAAELRKFIAEAERVTGEDGSNDEEHACLVQALDYLRAYANVI